MLISMNFLSQLFSFYRGVFLYILKNDDSKIGINLVPAGNKFKFIFKLDSSETMRNIILKLFFIFFLK